MPTTPAPVTPTPTLDLERLYSATFAGLDLDEHAIFEEACQENPDNPDFGGDLAQKHAADFLGTLRTRLESDAINPQLALRMFERFGRLMPTIQSGLEAEGLIAKNGVRPKSFISLNPSEQQRLKDRALHWLRASERAELEDHLAACFKLRLESRWKAAQQATAAHGKQYCEAVVEGLANQVRFDPLQAVGGMVAELQEESEARKRLKLNPNAPYLGLSQNMNPDITHLWAQQRGVSDSHQGDVEVPMPTEAAPAAAMRPGMPGPG